MGRPKALLEYGNGTFLSTILERLDAAQVPLVVVTSPGLHLELPERRVLINPDPGRGQLSSLRLALDPEAPWVMMVLVDHPAVTEGTYRALKEAAEKGGADLWAPSYRNRRGHPVVFGAACYQDLQNGPLAEGARYAVSRHRQRRVEVAVDDPGIHLDVDTPEDYLRLRG